MDDGRRNYGRKHDRKIETDAEGKSVLEMAEELPKLVRDKIPEIIEDDGKEAEVRRASEDELEELLRKKIREEAKEFEDEGEVAELADLYAVFQRYLEVSGISVDRLQELEKEKSDRRGGFEENIVLESVD